jgi:hypothetical protein
LRYPPTYLYDHEKQTTPCLFRESSSEKERGFRTKAQPLKPLLYTVDRIEDHVMPSAGISIFSNPKLLVQILILLDNFEKDFVATSCGSFPTREARVVCWLN